MSLLPPPGMRDIGILFIHPLTTAAKLLGPGGATARIAENHPLKQQLLVVIFSGDGRIHRESASD